MHKVPMVINTAYRNNKNLQRTEDVLAREVSAARDRDLPRWNLGYGEQHDVKDRVLCHEQQSSRRSLS
jgi:hypothetical protein